MEVGGEHREVDVAGCVELLQDAKSVIIVPGYGLAVAKAQYAIAEVGDEDDHHAHTQTDRPQAGRQRTKGGAAGLTASCWHACLPGGACFLWVVAGCGQVVSTLTKMGKKVSREDLCLPGIHHHRQDEASDRPPACLCVWSTNRCASPSTPWQAACPDR